MSGRIARWTSVAILLALLVAFLPPPGTRAAEVEIPRPQYRLKVDLDFATARLAVQQEIRYANATGETLRSLVFGVTPASYGAFTLDRVAVEGQPAAALLNGSRLEVSLPDPLAPGSAVGVTLEFRIAVPSPGTQRFGFAQGILALGNWFPILAVYRPGSGWDRSPYVDRGDAFFTEAADYEVQLSTDADVVVAHSGDDAGSWPGRWRFTMKQSRDFALALSRRYITQSRVVDGVTVSSFVLPEHAALAGQYLETGAETLSWFSRTLGAYPYQSLHLAETIGPEAMGQEYPGLIFISSGATALGGGMGSSLSYLVAHEVAHQWFYAIVGNDQVSEPWLDEALASYLPYRFWAATYPGIYASAWPRFQARAAREQAAAGKLPIDRSIYDYPNEGAYFAIVYRRGAIFLDEVRQILGDYGFLTLLRDFVARYRFGIARGDDFLALATSRAPEVASLVPVYFARSARPSGLEFPTADGYFYKQANGQGGAGETGFSVTNLGGIRFWDEFQRVGGVGALGYPISRRFLLDGFTVQAFQKAILQWRPESGRVAFLNVLDRLSEAGRDDWLLVQRQTPRPFDSSADRALSWEEVIRRHLQLLEGVPAVRTAYLKEAQWLDRYGLPMSAAEFPNVSVVRAQRAVFQLWKVDTPWARAGQVTIANGGDLAKESGLLPPEATVPEVAQ